MIKKVLVCISLITCGIAYFTPKSVHSYSTPQGSPGGVTGSSGDGGVTCKNCHSMTGSPTVNNSVFTTNIPGTGYVPGQTYNCTLTVSEGSRTRYGFEITAENSAKVRKGLFVVGTGTKTLSSGTRLTHTNDGIDGPANFNTWTFKWTAPAAGTGTITFYGAYLAANKDGISSGDLTFKYSQAVNEDLSSGVSQYLQALNKLSVYPNPAEEVITITSPAKKELKSAEIYSVTGASMGKVTVTDSRANVAHLPGGVYMLKTESGVVRFVKK